MEQTLYRKYRPQVFAEVIGQNHIKVTLLNELTSGRLSHAYLFTGPRGVGKTTVARLLAKAVNCLSPQKDGDADNTCAACQEIASGRSLDLIEIDAASHTGVENVRSQIIENARFTPSRWKYKVFIIDETHMLSLSAFNALLKTLEEPPEHALFILATTEIHKVPETIISRCQRFDFRRLRHEDLVERLHDIVAKERANVTDDVLATVARFARGSSRDAESLLGQVLTLGGEQITMEEAGLVLPRTSIDAVVELFTMLVRKDATAALTKVNTLVQEGVHLQQFASDLIEFLRKALLLKVSTQLDTYAFLELSKEQEQLLQQQLALVTAQELEAMLRIFLEQEQQMRASILPQLPFELAVVELTLGGPTTLPAVTVAEPPATSGQVPPAAPAEQPLVPQAPPLAKKRSRPRAAAQLTVESVRQRWTEILAALQAKNQSLRLTCNVAVPEAVEEGTLVLGVGFSFHRDRIEEPKNRAVIEEVVSDAFGLPVAIRAVISERAPRTVSYEREANIEQMTPVPAQKEAGAQRASTGADDGLWDALIEAFGSGKASSV